MVYIESLYVIGCLRGKIPAVNIIIKNIEFPHLFDCGAQFKIFEGNGRKQ